MRPIERRQRGAILMIFCAFTSAFAGALAPATNSYAAGAGGATAVPDHCSMLKNVQIKNTEIVSVSPEGGAAPLTSLKTFFGVPIGKIPAFCRVTARLHPTTDSDIGIEVWMPAKNWNGRLHGVGVGGFAGTFDYDSLASAVRGGQVGFASDMGHKGKGAGPNAMTDSSWAKGHPEKVRDYGSRAVHLGTVVAKQIIKAFYGRDVQYSYFVGCSGGGRQGLMEAALFPRDYDGILAGDPAQSWTALAMAWTNSIQAQLAPGAGLLPSQMEFLQSEVIKQCDAIDGQVDGLIADPRRCHVDTSKLACGTASSTKCFSPAQINALNRIYAGPRDTSGRLVVPTFLPGGAEAGVFGWGAYITTGTPGVSRSEAHVNGLFQNIVQQPFATAATFNWDRDPARLRAALSKELDAPANLRRFFARGGKLLLYHGWADPAIAPENTLNYYRVVRAESGSKALGSMRLYMIPGFQHCFGGVGPNSFGQFGAPLTTDSPSSNIVASLQQWVEKGRRPEGLKATFGGMNYLGGRSEDHRKRLLCPWPSRSVLRPGRDSSKAESYACVEATE